MNKVKATPPCAAYERDAALGANLRKLVAAYMPDNEIYLCLMMPHEHISLCQSTLDEALAAAVAALESAP